MLTKAQIETNTTKFINMMSEIKRDGVEDLKAFLLESDFFCAPASKGYHSSYEGGLCQHTLNVLGNLMTLADIYVPGKYTVETLFLVAMFHDLSKVNFYEKYAMNKKVYFNAGTKHDEIGNFEWQVEIAYKVREDNNRFVAGTHGFNSVMLLSRYVKLSEEESVAILNHHGGMDDNGANKDLTSIYNNSSLAVLLHLADMLSCYIDERL